MEKKHETELEVVRPRLKFPHEDSEIAVYINKRIEALAGIKSQREIAAEVGYEKPNMISMLKRGETKVPLQKVFALAHALQCDPMFLFRLAFKQQFPDMVGDMDQIFGRYVTKNEFEGVRAIRKGLRAKDPKQKDSRLTSAQLHAIEAAVAEND